MASRRPCVVVAEVVDELFDPHRVGGRELVHVQESPDVRVGRRIDVDREGGQRFLARTHERVLGHACVGLGACWRPRDAVPAVGTGKVIDCRAAKGGGGAARRSRRRRQAARRRPRRRRPANARRPTVRAVRRRRLPAAAPPAVDHQPSRLTAMPPAAPALRADVAEVPLRRCPWRSSLEIGRRRSDIQRSVAQSRRYACLGSRSAIVYALPRPSSRWSPTPLDDVHRRHRDAAEGSSARVTN